MAAKRKNGVLCPSICDPFISLDDASFKTLADDAITRLRASTSLEGARGINDALVRPLEFERVRRSAVGREELDLLFVTVGAQANSPTLAILASPARFVVLLHTIEEKLSADATINALGLDATEAALELIGNGKEPAALYRAVFDEWTRRGRPEKVGVDITGGLKPMSAAAAVASFALPNGRTYYMDSDQRSLHEGKFKYWVNERRIELANPFQVFGEIRRTTGRELLKTRRYEAASAVYGQLLEDEDRLRAQLSGAYDALEKLDFKRAAHELNELCERLGYFAHVAGKKDDALVQAQERIRANAQGALNLLRVVEKAGKDDPVTNLAALESPDCLDFGEMLLARAEHAAPDVAALLAYRCLELVPQRRLALRGKVNPSKVDWSALGRRLDRSVSDLIDMYNAEAKKEYHLDSRAPPNKISSVQAYGLLAVAFPDDVTKMMRVDEFAGAGTARNRSLLAHGLQQVAPDVVNNIRSKARKLFDALLDVEKMSAVDKAALKQRHALLDVE